jgi:hypothetical protein
MKRTAFICIFFCVQVSLNAQADFKPGFLVTTGSDTLRGWIDYRSDIQMGQVCAFRKSEKSETVLYYPETVSSYKFTDGKYFVSKQVGPKKAFLEYLFKGRLDILYWRDDRGDHYYLQTVESGLVELPYEEGIQYRNGAEYFYKSNKHKGLLKYYTKDAPKLAASIEKIDRPEHKYLIELAEKYHKLFNQGSSKPYYQKKDRVFKVDIEGVIGVVQVPNVNANINGQSPFGGLLLHFWLPRLNERLYIRTGFLYSTFQLKNESAGLLKFPIQVEYIMPLGRIQPKAALGVNLQNPFFAPAGPVFEVPGIAQALMLGANIRLDKRLQASVAWDLDFWPNSAFPILPRSLFSSAFTIGLVLKL